MGTNGMGMRFGLYAVDPVTKARRARPAAEAIGQMLRARHPGGPLEEVRLVLLTDDLHDARRDSLGELAIARRDDRGRLPGERRGERARPPQPEPGPREVDERREGERDRDPLPSARMPAADGAHPGGREDRGVVATAESATHAVQTTTAAAKPLMHRPHEVARGEPLRTEEDERRAASPPRTSRPPERAPAALRLRTAARIMRQVVTSLEPGPGPLCFPRICRVRGDHKG